MQEFDLSGGALALDFANTISRRGTPRSIEHLDGYADLLAFSRQAGSLAPGVVDELAELAARDPSVAERALANAISLREALYRLFSAVAAGKPPARADLDLLNRWLGETMRHARLVRGPNGYELVWEQLPALDRPLWPIVRAAADLLVDAPTLARVRECAAEDCAWLFVDTSKNRSRQWCDMRTCGNRAKARRFQARRRGPAT